MVVTWRQPRHRFPNLRAETPMALGPRHLPYSSAPPPLGCSRTCCLAPALPIHHLVFSTFIVCGLCVGLEDSGVKESYQANWDTRSAGLENPPKECFSASLFGMLHILLTFWCFQCNKKTVQIILKMYFWFHFRINQGLSANLAPASGPLTENFPVLGGGPDPPPQGVPYIPEPGQAKFH